MSESYDQSETFEPHGSLKRTTLTSGLVLFIPLAGLAWFIVTSILAAVDVPVRWLFGLTLGGAIMAALHLARSKKLEALLAGAALTFDSRGITQEDPVATRFVSWDGLRGGRMGQAGRRHVDRSDGQSRHESRIDKPPWLVEPARRAEEGARSRHQRVALAHVRSCRAMVGVIRSA